MGGQPTKKVVRIKPKLDPDPENYGWEPMCTAKNMEIYIIRTPEFNHVLARISPRSQPFWVRVKYLSFFHWKIYLWCIGTNKQTKRIWLGPELTQEILSNIPI